MRLHWKRGLVFNQYSGSRVDEADFVEVDNDTLYALTDSRLSIVRGFSEMNPELLDQITVETMGQTAGMYLHGDRLTILSDNMPNVTCEIISWKTWGMATYSWSATDCNCDSRCQ